jgi:hypothetical protein
MRRRVSRRYDGRRRIAHPHQASSADFAPEAAVGDGPDQPVPDI